MAIEIGKVNVADLKDNNYKVLDVVFIAIPNTL